MTAQEGGPKLWFKAAGALAEMAWRRAKRPENLRAAAGVTATVLRRRWENPDKRRADAEKVAKATTTIAKGMRRASDVIRSFRFGKSR